MKQFCISILLVILSLNAQNAHSETLTLVQYLEKAQKESPDVAIEEAKVKAAGAKASGVRINPPMVGYMQMKEGPSTNPGYEVSQEIPFPSKIMKDKEMRNLEYISSQKNRDYSKALILAQARKAYLDFWTAYQKLEISKEKQHWIQHHIRLSRTTTRADSSSQIHLLEAESDQDMLENELIQMSSDLVEKRNELRIFVPSLNVNELQPVEPNLVKMEITKTEKSPLIAARESDLLAMKAQEDLSKQKYLPDFFVRLRQFNGIEMTTSSQEIMVGVNLPFLFFWQPKAEVAEAQAKRQIAESELLKSKVEFETKVASLVAKADSLLKQLENLKSKLLPRAEKRKKLVTNLSQRTMESLDQHRMVVIGYLDLKLKAVELRQEYENAVSELLALTGERVGTK